MTGRGSGIRLADPGDLPQLVSMWLEITRHHATLDPLFTLRPGAEAEVRELLRAVLRDPDAAVFVWSEADLPQAVCIVRIDRAPPILAETERAEITDLGVRPEIRRRGVGRALADRAFAWARARGVSRVEVRVAAGNREGQAFWRALGFGDLMDVLHKRA